MTAVRRPACGSPRSPSGSQSGGDVPPHQVLGGLVNVFQVFARGLHRIAGSGPVAEEDSVVAAPEQLFYPVLPPQAHPALEAHSQSLQQRQGHFLLQLEVWNAVKQQTARARPGVKDCYAVAALGELFGDGQARRARAHHGQLVARGRHGDRNGIAVAVPQVVHREGFELADSNGLRGAAENAGAFTQLFLRADATADVRHIAGLEELQGGLGEPPLGDQEHRLRDAVVQRAGPHARGVLALEAPRGLLDCHLRGEPQEHLVPVIDPGVGLLLGERRGLDVEALPAARGSRRAVKLLGVVRHAGPHWFPP